MLFPKSLFPLLAIFALLCQMARAESAWPQLKYTDVASVPYPVHLTHAGDGSGRLFIPTLPGIIREIKQGELQGGAFLDITARVLTGNERGLLSMAFPPGYATKR